MATLTDLNAKRTEMNTAVQTYRQTVIDFNAATATQTDVDNAKAVAQAKGDEYSKLALQVRKDNPELTDEQFYSNPAAMPLAMRTDVATIVRQGVLFSGISENFNAKVLDPEVWNLDLQGTSVSASFYDGDTGAVLRLKSNTRYTAFNGNFARIVTKAAFKPGTSFKVRIKRVGSHTDHVYLGLINAELDTYARWQSANGHSYVGAFKDESAIGSGGLRLSYNEGPTAFSEMELKWVDETTLEWYQGGVLTHTSTADFHSDHYFYLESGADSYANWVDQYLDIDTVEITPP